MDYLSIRYRDGDSVHTQLVTPLASWLTPVSTANAAVRRYADRLPKPVVAPESKSSRRGRSLKFLAACLLPVFLLAGVLIVLQWNKGTLRIESEADDVPIRIVQGRHVVEELTVSKSGESVRIAAGNYQVEIGGQIDGLAIDDGSVTLQRGGNDIVRIVKVAPATTALGDWPYGRLLKDLQEIKPPGGVPVIPSGTPISVAMGNELTKRLETAAEGDLDKWVKELERITGEELDGEMARRACRTYIVNRMNVLFDHGKWNKPRADKLFFRARLISTSEAEAWRQAFESLLGEAIGQTDNAILDGGPSYAVPLTLISTDALFEIDEDSVASGYSDIQEKYRKDAAVKYRKRLSQLSKQDIAAWRSKVDRYGGTKLDAAINIVLLDDYFLEETFQDGDFEATLGGMDPVRSAGQPADVVGENSTDPKTRFEYDVYANSSPLLAAVNEFNSSHKFNDQPPLTLDEVVACISWFLHHEEPPESKLRADLRLLTEQRQLPKGWEITAAESSPTIGNDVASQWTINLECVSKDRAIPVRQWAVSPPEVFLEPTETAPDENGIPLQAAINAFNASRNTINGIRQPPLTLKEVLAAIAIWKQKRNEAGVDDATFENFQRIARTHYLPADTRFQMIPRFETSSGVYSICSVSIVVPQVSKPEWTYAFSIRRQFIALNAELASQIHWGKPADNGLQAGFRLIPAQEVYRVGQVVDVEFLYRSIYAQAPVSLPNALTYQEAHLRRGRTNDELEVIKDQQEKIVGGWISAAVTEEPIARKGQRIGFTDDPKADFKTKVGTRLIVSPTDGKLSLSFTVANPADGAEGLSLKTGEAQFNVVADDLSQANREITSGIDATASPVPVASNGNMPDEPAKQSPNPARRKTVKNLTRIAIALQRYHELHGRFPPATIHGKNGKGGPPHSWRVELLPLLGHGGLYDRYNFKAAWDTQRNLAVLAQMPDVYRSPLDQGNSTNASYFGVVSDDIFKRAAELQEMRKQTDSGPDSEYAGEYRNVETQPHYEKYTPEATVFWKQRGASFIDMLDGTSNCIAVIEAKRNIPWTKPEDIEYSADQPLPKFGGWFEQGVHAAFADGTVKFLANDNDEQTIRNLLTISDGQPTKPLLVRRLRVHGAIAVPADEPVVAAGPETYQVPGGPLLQIQSDEKSILTEADIVEVAATTDPNNPSGGDIVAITLTEEAGKRLLEATTKLSEQATNGYMVITFDRKVLSAPRVLARIGNRLTITGNINAKALAEQIQAAMDEVDTGEASPPANVDENSFEPIQEVPRREERFRNANTNPINLQPAQEEGTPIPDTPTIEEATRQFNLQSATDRATLFDPPIGELSLQQMRDAFAEAAGQYREIGEHAIADTLQNIAETGKLPSDALTPVYASGPYHKDKDGQLTQKQIAPMLVLPDGRGGARLVPLRSAELIYNKLGRSSKRYGDLFEESQQNKDEASANGNNRH